MTRLQKKCFLFSLCLHGALIGILIISSAFRSQPTQEDLPILTMIPSNITDSGTTGGGGPAMTVAPKPAPVQQQQASPVHTTPVAPPPKPTPEPPKPVVHEETSEPIVPVHHPRTHTPEPDVTPRELSDDGLPTPKPKHKTTHVVTPTFDEVKPSKSKSRNRVKPDESSEESAQAAAAANATARAEARRAAIGRTLDRLASRVLNDGAPGTAVDLPGQGGGPAFANYRTVIYNYYFRAWIAPDSIANKMATVDVKIVVERSGRVISSEVINHSEEPALDKSVERALRAVPELPPFPAGATDEQRTFLLRFDLEAKQGSG